jgi:hypothetical protein
MYDLERAEQLYNIYIRRRTFMLRSQYSIAASMSSRDSPANSAIAARAMTEVLTCSQQS